LKNNLFTTLGVDEKISSHLQRLGFTHPTQIQKETLPFILEKKDIIAKAATGSGKTLSFSLGVLHNLNPKKFEIQTVILTPTRELANQVANELRSVMKYHHNVKVLTLCGGVPYKPQVHSLSHKAHIIVGTPGRILKHLQNDNFNTHLIDTLVLDEADRMLDMGFFDDVKEIINHFPKKRQTLLYSATYPTQIESLADEFMNEPEIIDITDEQTKPKIQEVFYNSTSKNEDVKNLLNLYTPNSVIIFCNMKIECDELADYLESFDIYPLVLHSDLEQRDRDETLTLFENKSYKILIATDVASRGLDVDNVELVINHSLPKDFELYTHRIGRTGRNEKEGISVALIDGYQSRFVDEYTDQELQEIGEPTFKYDDSSLYDTLLIFGGKKQKVRRGDIVGSLTNEYNLDFKDIGIISQKEKVTYVALTSKVAQQFKKKDELKIKGKFYHMKFVS
jgi:ATP-independent RNA helicase DbpA